MLAQRHKSWVISLVFYTSHESVGANFHLTHLVYFRSMYMYNLHGEVVLPASGCKLEWCRASVWELFPLRNSLSMYKSKLPIVSRAADRVRSQMLLMWFWEKVEIERQQWCKLVREQGCQREVLPYCKKGLVSSLLLQPCSRKKKKIFGLLFWLALADSDYKAAVVKVYWIAVVFNGLSLLCLKQYSKSVQEASNLMCFVVSFDGSLLLSELWA